METLWLVAFGVLFAGYLVLAGVDYGAGILLPYAARTDGERRLVLNAVGPFLLSNEVWLLASIGIMIGTLPGLETRLLTGTFPLAVVAVAGAIVLNVAVQLRSRQQSLRRFWDVVICAGGVAAAFGWGAVLTSLAGGLPLDAEGHVTGASVTAFSLLGGLSGVVLLGAHGAVFLAARTGGVVGARARLAAPVLCVAASLLVVTTLITGRTGGHLGDGFRSPVVALLLMLVALVALKIALWRVARHHAWQALAASATAVALMPLLVFAGKFPTLITASSPGVHPPALDELAAPATSLALITWTAGPVLLLVIAAQAYGWWVFRGRVTRQSPIFY